MEPRALISERLRRWLAPGFLVLAVLVPYYRLTTLQSIIATDDRIVSDVYHGEFPGRVELARLLVAGELPVWTRRMCTGYPLLAGLFPDPLTIATFGALRPVAALNVFLLITLIVAALGTFALARRFGASRLGGTLAGVSFSWSGYMVCQLKHLGIVATVCWLPVGLLLLDRALSLDEDDSIARRLRALVPFALVVALQWISNFPQSAYISSVTYGGFALAWAIVHLRQRSLTRAAGLFSAAVVAIALGIVCSAVALLPIYELSSTTFRKEGVPWEYATMLPYSPRDILTFFIPYANGDVSNLTYTGSGLFWENYGYVGLLTVLLALFALVRVRRFHVLFLTIATVVAYLIVLGPATPFFKIVFYALPGMESFRFPTRWLVVVDLALAVLGGLGLTHLEELIERRGRRAWPIAAAIVALTTADLVFHQLRQNAFADAKSWMQPPATAEFIHAQPAGYRIYSPLHYKSHSLAFARARGWSDLAPFYAHRELLQPNTNLLWGLDTCDCYAGQLPDTSFLMWGEFGAVNLLAARRGAVLHVEPELLKLLALNSVRYVLSPWPTDAPAMREAFRVGDTRVYEIAALPRAFLAAGSVQVGTLREAIIQSAAPTFDPARAVVLESPAPLESSTEAKGTATIVSERASAIELETVSDAPAWMVLTDQWYPGWSAKLDGVDAPLVRANGRHRAVRVPSGTHRVAFTYRSAGLALGAKVSAVALLLLLGVYVALRSKAGTVR